MTGLLPIALDYRDEVQMAFLVGVAASALRWGAGPERASALALLYLEFIDQAYHAIFGPGVELASLDLGHAMIDLTTGGAMLGIAVVANRMYSLWIGALQIIAIQAHVARDLVSEITPLAYAIMYVAPSYFQIALLAAGIWAHRKRRRIYGTYRSWRISWPPSWVPRPLGSLLN